MREVGSLEVSLASFPAGLIPALALAHRCRSGCCCSTCTRRRGAPGTLPRPAWSSFRRVLQADLPQWLRGSGEDGADAPYLPPLPTLQLQAEERILKRWVPSSTRM